MAQKVSHLFFIRIVIPDSDLGSRNYQNWIPVGVYAEFNSVLE